MSDESSKLEALKTLKQEMRSWKKQDMKKKKNGPLPENDPTNSDKQAEESALNQTEQDPSQGTVKDGEQDDSLLKKLLAKMLQ